MTQAAGTVPAAYVGSGDPTSGDKPEDAVDAGGGGTTRLAAVQPQRTQKSQGDRSWHFGMASNDGHQGRRRLDLGTCQCQSVATSLFSQRVQSDQWLPTRTRNETSW